MTNEYVETFYIIPRYIRHLPGITLSYLDVYETIFQFWNKNKSCFLSEEALCERTGYKRTQIYEALSFFEKHNELKRIKKSGKRYLIKPEKAIITDCTEIIPTSGIPDCDVRTSGRTTSGGADHNIKKVNKEKECVGTSASHTQISTLKKQKAETQALESHEANEIFKAKFEGRDITLEELFAQCQEHYDQKRLWATKSKFVKWLQNERPDNFAKSKKQTSATYDVGYLEYLSRFKNDIRIQLISADAIALTYREWSCASVQAS